MTPQISMVICTLDEAEAIGPVILETLKHLSFCDVEIIVVDDSLDESTADVVRSLVATDDRIRLIRRPGERGLAAAAAAGWAASRGRVLGLMDGDGQHDPAVLPLLFQGLECGRADIAVASRYAPGARTGLRGFRHGLSQSGTFLARVITGVAITDPLAGCFLFRREWWDEARPRLSPIGYKILLDLALSGWRTPQIFETPTSLRHRLGGVSKLDTRVIVELAAQLVEKRSCGLIPARFVMFGTVGASGVAVNVGLLWSLAAVGSPFWLAQALAIMTAMTTNFLLNNLLTFRDRRLSGRSFWRGLTAFYFACAGGAVINQLLGLGLYSLGVWPAVAGVTGALSAALWNFAAVSRITWGEATTQRAVLHVTGDVPARGSPRQA